VELLRSCLDCIRQLDPVLHAFVLVTEDRAMADARAAENRLMRGASLGPLDGIPIGHKDVVDTAGIPTTAQSRLLRANIPGHDATVAARLSAAGTVMLGKLTTHEFALGGPSFDLPWPPARNPWALDRFTGGSSSGPAAALAAGMVLGATGSDTMGSIRSPASLCGLAGFKPSYGLVSRAGVFPLACTLDHVGPMARNAEDCALLLQVMAGFDARDPASAREAIPNPTAALGNEVRGLRIGVIRHFHEADQPASAAVIRNLDAALSAFRDLGAEIGEVRLAPLMDWHAAAVTIMLTEAYAVHAPWLRERCAEYGELFRERVLLGALIGGADYLRAQQRRRALAAGMAEALQRHDLLVSVAQACEAPLIEGIGRWGLLQSPSLAAPFNLTGCPAISVCSGYGENGLPTGIQIAGRAFEDGLVLRAAHAFERASGYWERRPDLLELAV
jgi:aspartyl-tRNA(Asn)/glutamyl-tRNA(Gln) amidotransferase subunit A